MDESNVDLRIKVELLVKLLVVSVDKVVVGWFEKVVDDEWDTDVEFVVELLIGLIASSDVWRIVVCGLEEDDAFLVNDGYFVVFGRFVEENGIVGVIFFVSDCESVISGNFVEKSEIANVEVVVYDGIFVVFDWFVEIK